ncbi:hypothetical protein NMY22_g12734 [Coprinellus aureogranulatus]|nr:hypothetical protein NMY22_g12734 [Coprinellus aureogranulatus]
MDALHFDGYASYSDSSAPRTPSPNQPPLMNINFPLKQGLIDEPVRNLFHEGHHDDNAVIVHPENPYGWAGPQPVANLHFTHNNGSRGSLLQDIYADDQHQQHQLTPEFPNHRAPHDFQAMRRATFPYVRHDREDLLPPIPQQVPHFFPHQQQQFQQIPPRHDAMYPESITLPQPGDHFSSPQPNYQEFDDGANIKLEDGSMMMPAQNFYRTQSASSSNMCHPMTMSYMSPHTGLPVQHTDDAASKETQYLRRRCFNCHTTEPPSWRRSTLNPGKIVCNNSGPETKARKQNKRTLSPKSRVGTAAAAGNGGAPGSPNLIKKEPREFGLVRRSSVSSISSAQSGSGASDWDDNVSLYSSGSAPPTSYNSPAISPYPLSRDHSSSPNGGGRRALLSFTRRRRQPSLEHQTSPATSSSVTNSPRRSQTSPETYFPQASNGQDDYFMMRRRTESVGSVQGTQLNEQPSATLVASPAPTAVVS